MTGEVVEVAEFYGDWIMDLTLVSRAKVPVLGDFITRSRSELSVRLEAGASGVRQTHRICRTDLNDGRGIIKTIIPPSFIAALPVHSFAVDLSLKGSTWHYAAAFERQIIGWSGVGDLPTEASDPRIRDEDGDGHPGMTVWVEAPIAGTGEVYVVQAGQTSVTGIWDGQAFSGNVGIPEFAQKVVGASNRMLLNGPEILPDAPQSSFRMTRGVASCGRVP